MQCHNYTSDVYNKPNRLKIDPPSKMAAMCGRSTPLAGNAYKTSRPYISMVMANTHLPTTMHSVPFVASSSMTWWQ